MPVVCVIYMLTFIFISHKLRELIPENNYCNPNKTMLTRVCRLTYDVLFLTLNNARLYSINLAAFGLASSSALMLNMLCTNVIVNHVK